MPIPPEPKSPAELIEIIRRYVPSAAPYRPDDLMSLAGQWGFDGGLCGWDVHLFRDGTYLNTHWADISPLAICGQGQWAYDGWTVSLVQESGPHFGIRRDRRFVPLMVSVSLNGEDSRVHTMLLGAVDGFQFFMEKAEEFGESFILCSALARRSQYSAAASQETKAELLTKCYCVEGNRFVPPPT